MGRDMGRAGDEDLSDALRGSRYQYMLSCHSHLSPHRLEGRGVEEKGVGRAERADKRSVDTWQGGSREVRSQGAEGQSFAFAFPPLPLLEMRAIWVRIFCWNSGVMNMFVAPKHSVREKGKGCEERER